MSLKAELEVWAAGLKAYEAQDLTGAMREFDKIADTSKINWNIGIILATMGRHQEAVERFCVATRLDMYMTIAYQQAGVSNFMLGRYEGAYKDFEDALLYMRGNQTINYEQLGLDFRLFSAEVLFNFGLTKIYLGQIEAGMADLREAALQKQTPDHAVIDDAIRDKGIDYNVFSVPVGILFKPSAGKLKNLEARDYMGKAVLVAASDASDAYTTFTGITRLRRGQAPAGAPLDPTHPSLLGRSASVSSIPKPDNSMANLARMNRSNTVAVPTGGGVPGRPTLDRLDTTATRAPPFSRKPEYPNGRPTNTLGIDGTATRPLSPSSIYGGVQDLDSPPNETVRTPQVARELRITELYDDYYNTPGVYGDEMPALPPIGGAKAGYRTNRNGSLLGNKSSGYPVNRDLSMSSMTSPSGRFGGPATLSRSASGLSRTQSRNGGSVPQSVDGWYGNEDVALEMVKIRIKVHVGELTRGMSITSDQSHRDFIDALRRKFPELARSGGVNVRFKDEDGDMLSMQDEGDFEAAVDVARVMSNGRAEGKLEIWVD